MKNHSNLPHLGFHDLACMRGYSAIYRNLSHELLPHTILWVKGANGSGKTSLLRQLAGLLPLESGQITWDGQNISPHNMRYSSQLCYFGHRDGLRAELTVRENIENLAMVKWDKNLEKICGELLLRRKLSAPIRFLSQGQRKKTALAALLARQDYPLWLLDEPFVNLDIDTTQLLQNYILERQKRGWITIFTSHQDINLPTADILSLDDVHG